MRCSEATLKRVRDYAVDEPSFTTSFAAWDLSRTGEPISRMAVKLATDELERLGIVRLIEDGGRMGKVYAYDPPQNGSRPRSRPALPELDAGIGVGRAAPQRGVVVPHTRIRGESDSPGEDRRRQARGVRLSRRKGR